MGVKFGRRRGNGFFTIYGTRQGTNLVKISSGSKDRKNGGPDVKHGKADF